MNLSCTGPTTTGTTSSASVISFPIQPFLGRNPCLQRNLNPVSVPDAESPESQPLDHTLKFNPRIRSAAGNINNNNNNWPSAGWDRRNESGSRRMNSERNVYPVPTGGRHQTSRLQRQHQQQLPTSRPGPIPQAIHNACLLPKQQNHSVCLLMQQQERQSSSRSGAHSHSDQEDEGRHVSQVASLSLARRVMQWAFRRLSFPRLHVNSHLLTEEAEPLSALTPDPHHDKDVTAGGKDASSTRQQEDHHQQHQQRQEQREQEEGEQQQSESEAQEEQGWQQSHHHYDHHHHRPTDETSIVISEDNEARNAILIHDKGTAPKGV